MSTFTLIVGTSGSVELEIDTDNELVTAVLQRQLGEGVLVRPDGSVDVDGEVLILGENGVAAARADTTIQPQDTVIVNKKFNNG